MGTRAEGEHGSATPYSIRFRTKDPKLTKNAAKHWIRPAAAALRDMVRIPAWPRWRFKLRTRGIRYSWLQNEV